MNTNFLKIALVAAMALAPFVATPTMARTAPSTAIGARFDVALLPPVGMIMFCKSNASHCRPGNVGSVEVSRDLLALLSRVNTRVNNSISPVYDRGLDKWTVNASAGDCEDYVLTKRAALIRSGVPSGSLRIATTTTRRGEGHAILVVKTSGGDYVLDNMRPEVRTLGASGYRIRTISTQNPTVWTAG